MGMEDELEGVWDKGPAEWSMVDARKGWMQGTLIFNNSAEAEIEAEKRREDGIRDQILLDRSYDFTPDLGARNIATPDLIADARAYAAVSQRIELPALHNREEHKGLVERRGQLAARLIMQDHGNLVGRIDNAVRVRKQQISR